MCLQISIIKHNELTPKIAKYNIRVYKVLVISDNINIYFTPFQHFRVEFSCNKAILMVENFGIKDCFINAGIHAYRSSRYIKHVYENECLCYAIIPKDTEYFIGVNGDIVSKKLIVFKTEEAFNKFKEKESCITIR